MGPREGDVGFWWAQENRGKKTLTLDLHDPQGQEIVKRLVPQVDVILENFRPGILEKWGLGWETLSQINPRLIMARITAFGQTGPRSHGPGFAAIGSAFGGTWYLNGTSDQPPVRPTPVYPDYLTGLFTATQRQARNTSGKIQPIAGPPRRNGHFPHRWWRRLWQAFRARERGPAARCCARLRIRRAGKTRLPWSVWFSEH
jgi:crotonobetainyl-CoA:carnitine CoA-transferase CaiB-like acyl-CoA transferase